MKILFILPIIAAALFKLASASEINKGVPFSFASVIEGREILMARDDFVQRLSRFDRSARLKTAKDVSEDTYLRFVGESVQEWSAEDKSIISSAIASLQIRINELSLPWPEVIYLVKTTGNEEGHAAYTRSNAIVLPAVMLVQKNMALINKILVHELFHILTRNNPELKDKLYASIGFHNCGEIAYPLSIRQTKLTNPDAPKNNYCILLGVDGMPVWAIPVLYSPTPEYDENRGGDFFDYLKFDFLLLQTRKSTDPMTATYDDQRIRLVGPDDVSGFYEQVGRNTDYIIHPEEILADNFALLVLGAENFPSPQIIHDIRELLEQDR